MEKRKSLTILPIISIVCVVIACFLSVISSNKAYKISNIQFVIIACVIAALVQIVTFIGLNRMKNIVMDILNFISTITATMALCLMIEGRTTLMGYVYFSDLESGNPVAVSAMNLAVVAWVFYIIAIICMIIMGFKNKK